MARVRERFERLAATPIARGTGAVVVLTGAIIFTVLYVKYSPDREPPTSIRYSWTQLVSDHGQTKVLLRLVVRKNSSCEDQARFIDDDVPVGLVKRQNTERNLFPIDLCEGLLDLDDSGVRLSNGRELNWKSIAGETPKRVVVIGDSGCNDKLDAANNKVVQNCGDQYGWPFARIAAAAGSLKGKRPDLVIHVGDIRYRGDDTWTYWMKDFFEPMRPLLAAAPLIIARGNHDNCYRDKGYGWKYLLAPTLQLERCTNKQNGLADVEDPYAIDLKYLRLVVIDSADSNYRCKSWGDAMQDEKHDLGASFKRLIASQDRLVWLVSHYPVFDLRPSQKCTKDVSKECKYCDSLFKLHELVAPALVGTKVDAVLSGDIHHYEILHAHVGSHWQTMQFVAGNSGTALDGATKNSDCLGSAPSAPVYCKGKLDDSRGYMAGHFDVEARLRNVFGFLVATWDQSSKTWQFQLHTLRQEDQTDAVKCQVPAGSASSCASAPAKN